MTVSTLRLKRSIAHNNRELIGKAMKNNYDEIEESRVGRGTQENRKKVCFSPKQKKIPCDSRVIQTVGKTGEGP